MSIPQLQVMPDSTLVPETKPYWTKVATNIFRHRNGTLYVKAKVAGRPFSKVLKTNSIETAKRKRDALLLAEHKRRNHCTDETITMGKLMEQFEKDIAADTKLKPRSKEYRLETLDQIKQTWPELYAQKPGSITEADCARWAGVARSTYSPTRFNGSLETLHRLFKAAEGAGLIEEDPARGVERASVPHHIKDLPTEEQLKRIFHWLETPQEKDAEAVHQRRLAAKTLRFMLYTGCRPEAARQATVECINLPRNEIILPMVKYDNRPLRVPIMPKARTYFEQLLAEYPGSGPLLPTQNPSIALTTACRELKLPHLVPSDMRKIFITVFLQITKDVALAAKLVGHKDKGKTLLLHYAHLLDDHAQAEMKRMDVGV